MNTFKLAILVGSLRKESYNKKIARSLIKMAPDTLVAEIIEIGVLPLYNEDLDSDPPAAWTAFRERMACFDAVLFVTPEYNRSVPGVLKNAIDVGSRPYGKSIWDGKPGAVISVSPGKMGGFGSNHHLRQSMVFLNVVMMAQPEAYIGSAAELFDDAGLLIKDSTKERLSSFLDSFQVWIRDNLKRED